MVNELNAEKKTLAVSKLAEGNSIRSIERMTGVHRDTIIHIALPPLSFWHPVGVECAMLTHILTGALHRRSLLAGQLYLLAFNRQIFGVVIVNSIGLALSTVAEELAALELISGAHLAWFDPAEGIYRTDRPLPEPMPWQNHIDAWQAWKKERQESKPEAVRECLSKIAEALGKLIKNPPQP